MKNHNEHGQNYQDQSSIIKNEVTEKTQIFNIKNELLKILIIKIF